MFERFTEGARRVVFFARYEAVQLGQMVIDTEHLMLGLLREGSIVLDLLERHSIRPSELRRILAKGATPEDVAAAIDIPLSPGAQQALAHASEEAERERVRNIGCDHLLIGLLLEPGAGDVLREAGLTLETARRDLAALREQSTQRPGDPATAMPKLIRFLDKLDAQRRPYRLSHPGRPSIRVELAHRDERWEVDFFADGQVEVVVFTAAPAIEGEDALTRLFE